MADHVALVNDIDMPQGYVIEPYKKDQCTQLLQSKLAGSTIIY